MASKRIAYLVVLLAMLVVFFNSASVFADCTYNATNDCYIPGDNCYLTDAYSKICPGTYTVNDDDNNSIIITTSSDNMVLDCQGATITFSQSSTPFAYGFGLYDTINWKSVSNNAIKNCNIVGGSGTIYGIDNYNGYNNTVINCTFKDLDRGVSTEGGSTYTHIINNTIINTTLGLSRAGIYIYGSDYNNIIGNTIITQGTIGIDNFSAGGKYTVVYNNTIINQKGSGGTGIMDLGMGWNVTNNYIYGFDVGMDMLAYEGTDGDLVVSDNVIDSCGSGIVSYGMYRPNITNNNLTNCSVAINLTDNSFVQASGSGFGTVNATITGNIITNSTFGIVSAHSSADIYNNVLCGNTQDFNSSDGFVGCDKRWEWDYGLKTEVCNKWRNSTGDFNKCSNPDGWNDTSMKNAGTTGCTYSCSGNNLVVEILSIDGKGNNSETTDTTPYVGFNISGQPSAVCNLFVNGSAKGSGTAFTGTSTMIDVNESLAFGTYNVYVNCSTSGVSNVSATWVFTVKSVCVDADGDGYNTTGGTCGPIDCNDTNNQIYPGVAETCDGIDNDCDGTTDNNLTQPSQSCTVGTGACQNTGTQTKTCNGASGWSNFGACSATPGTPTAETCDGIDNDCDGTTDNNLTQPSQSCTVGTGACQNTGTQTKTCNGASGWSNFGACSATPGTPTAETCDGIDNDCDGTTDNNLTQPSQSCTVGTGACQNTGTQTKTCNGASGWSNFGACSATPGTPTAETCDDNIDNDCDGFTDSADSDCSVITYYCDNDGDNHINSNPSGTCSGVGCYPASCDETPGDDCNDSNADINPSATEICNGIDDNCNNQIDENITPQSCTASNDCIGTQTCTSGTWSACATTLNNCDTECDGTIDSLCQADACIPCNCINGQTQNCSLQNGVCAGAQQTCNYGIWSDCNYGVSYEVSETLCDSLDNDCDGTTDEGCVSACTPNTEINTTHYCDANSSVQEKKINNTTCGGNYECGSNNCIESRDSCVQGNNSGWACWCETKTQCRPTGWECDKDEDCVEPSYANGLNTVPCVFNHSLIYCGANNKCNNDLTGKKIVSTRSDGVERNVYYSYWDVYAKGQGFEPNKNMTIYIVREGTTWTNNTNITPYHLTTPINVTTDANGNIPNTLLWKLPHWRDLQGGTTFYDIVVDENQDGKYQIGETVDGLNSYGFKVDPIWAANKKGEPKNEFKKGDDIYVNGDGLAVNSTNITIYIISNISVTNGTSICSAGNCLNVSQPVQAEVDEKGTFKSVVFYTKDLPAGAYKVLPDLNNNGIIDDEDILAMDDSEEAGFVIADEQASVTKNVNGTACTNDDECVSDYCFIASGKTATTTIWGTCQDVQAINGKSASVSWANDNSTSYVLTDTFVGNDGKVYTSNYTANITESSKMFDYLAKGTHCFTLKRCDALYNCGTEESLGCKSINFGCGAAKVGEQYSVSWKKDEGENFIKYMLIEKTLPTISTNTGTTTTKKQHWSTEYKYNTKQQDCVVLYNVTSCYGIPNYFTCSPQTNVFAPTPDNGCIQIFKQ